MRCFDPELVMKNSNLSWCSEASEVCYAYLSDVPYINDLQVDEAALAKSRWFTRGWTLQELIAPKTVIFYSRCWRDIGTRSSLRHNIASITRIHTEVFGGFEKQLSDFSVAQRMSWASERQTSRVEDIAYCLMGIFQVNMPMLYGEGSRAFFRLQEEIIKKTNDQTIFVWQTEDWTAGSSGLLANSPSLFKSSRDVIRLWNRSGVTSPMLGTGDFAITNKGIFLSLRMKHHDLANVRVTTVLLDCKRDNCSGCSIQMQLTRARLAENMDQSTWTGLYQRGAFNILRDITDEEASSGIYSSDRIYVEIEWVPPLYSNPGLQTSQKAILTISKGIEVQEHLSGLRPHGAISFQPRFNFDTKIFFPTSSLGHFVVVMRLSSLWKKLRIEVLNAILPDDQLKLKQVVTTIDRSPSMKPSLALEADKSGGEPVDRSVWPLAGGRHLLIIMIRTRMVGGIETFNVALDVCETHD